MVSTVDYLKQFAEAVPTWLKDHCPGRSINFDEVRHTRCAYYPGAGDDGSLIKCCNQAQCVHLFIQADYWYWGTDENGKYYYPEKKLTSIRGYRIIDTIEMEDFSQRQTNFHIDINYLVKGAPATCWWYKYTPRFKMVIYERINAFDEEIGSPRFAVILACYDGIALYDILFGNGVFTNLFIVLNQEHGFGGNYDRFCNLMQKIAINSNVLPPLMLTENQNIWDGYENMRTVPIIGGLVHNSRSIYKKNM